MRMGEMLLLFVLLLSVVAVLWGQRPRWWVGLPVTAVFLAMAQVLVEGYRWQMLPAYLLVLVMALVAGGYSRLDGPRGGRVVVMVGGLVGVLLFMVAVALPILLPVPQLLTPRGPYAVGTEVFYLVDNDRAEIYTAAPDDRRELMVQVWYPAQATTEAERVPYIAELDVAGPAIARRLGLPAFLFDHVDLVYTEARLKAPLVTEDVAYPVIIFSHGLQGFRNQNTNMVQDLASNGYVVVTIDHTYANVWSVFPDGRVTFYKGETIFTDGVPNATDGIGLVKVWAADIAFVLDEVTAWNGSEALPSLSPFNGRLDLSKVGVFGHSTGGGATVTFCLQDVRCRAGLALDGWLLPIEETLLATGVQQPFMFINAPAWLGPDNMERGRAVFEGLAQGGYMVTIEGTEHFDFTDLPLFSPLTPQLGLSGSINSTRGTTIMNDYVGAFFGAHLLGETVPLLAGERPYEEVTFEENGR